MSPELAGPKRATVARLLIAEGVDAQVALDVADKIIEYERNLGHQRDLYTRRHANADQGSDNTQASLQDANQGVEMSIDSMGRHLQGRGRVGPSDCTKVQSQETLHRSRGEVKGARKMKNETLADQRYMRRATNQLLKSLRHL